MTTKRSQWEHWISRAILKLSNSEKISSIFTSILIILENEAHLHAFNSLEKLEIIDTYLNLDGIGAICYSKNVCAIALPDKTQGSVVIKFYGEASPRTQTIKAHKKPITALALNEEGTLLATASAKVRIILGHYNQNIQHVII